MIDIFDECIYLLFVFRWEILFDVNLVKGYVYGFVYVLDFM